jgi:hypothetical protein
VRPLGSYLGLLITRRIRTRTERREIRCDFNKDVCYFRYLLDKAINRKKSITLDRESLIVKY